jgi:hypothetical protein
LLESEPAVLSLEIALSGGNEFTDLLGKAKIKEFLIVDENGYESETYSSNIPLSSMSGGTPPFSMTLIFEVKNEAQTFSLRLPDGQTIDLASILKSE